MLSKQIKKYLPDDLSNHPAIAEFLNAVNDSYASYEKDKALAERAFSISESEYIEINERLNNELQIKSRLMRTLKDTIGILGEESSDNIEDIGLLTDQLYRQVMMSSENEQIVDSLISSYLTGIV